MPEEVLTSGADIGTTFGASILATVATSTALAQAVAQLSSSVPVTSTADATATVSLSAIMPLVSSAVAAGTVVQTARTVETLSTAADVQPSVQFVRELSLTSSLNAAETLALRHFAIVNDTVAVTDASTAKLTNISTSSANITASLAPFSFPMVLTSDAVLASTLGAPTVRATVASAAAAASAAELLARVRFDLEAGAVAAAALTSKLTATQTLYSIGYVEAFVRLPATAIESFWTNTKTTGVAKWNSLKVNSIVEKDGALYAAGVDGVVELTDTGTHEGEIMWDLMDFGTPQKKTVDSLYMNGTAGGAMTVRVACEDGAWSYTTHLTSPTTKSENHRATLGRGLKSTQYRISIKAGHVFDIGAVHLQIADAKRRIGG